MQTFDVYPLFDIEPVRGDGIYLYDKSNTAFMDFYGGHAVISVGHSHPHYVKRITTQLNKLGFYSNSVKIPLQNELATLLGSVSGYNNYNLFLCNSGAEANENALKLASFKNGRKKIIAFQKAFHGRTSLAVAATDDRKLQAPVNHNPNITFLPWNDEAALIENFNDEVSAVIIEGIQGVGGVHVPTPQFLRTLRSLCDKFGAYLILDEIQSGYGRSGKFFAHQYASIKADLITVAKGMGNGFPVAGVLISPIFEAKHGLLGTTFGGNYLACAAAIAVLEIMKDEQLVENAKSIGHYLMTELKKMDHVREVRGQGLMIGIDLDEPCAKARQALLFEHKIFTGNSSDKNTLRILPPLCITSQQADIFLQALQTTLKNRPDMKQFLSVADAGNLGALINEALQIKKQPFAFKEAGRNKTIALLFMNPSLRTRLSTQKAAINLGMDVMVVNMDKDSWQIEFEDGAIMNSNKSEHIREAAAVISQYCDVIGLRCFPGLIDRDKDYNEQMLGSFLKYCNKPIISLESGTRHPLQSFADMISINETWQGSKPPKVVLTWAPHIKALPQAVPNSFAEWAVAYGSEVTIAQPAGYELAPRFSKGATVTNNQDEALKDADYVYVKNWSAYGDYGAMPAVSGNWLLTPEKLGITNHAKVMHCLPVRRNVELPDAILDGPSSMVQQQAGNRVWAAQTVIKKILEAL